MPSYKLENTQPSNDKLFRASVKWGTADFKGVKQQTNLANLGLGTIFKLFISSSYVKTEFYPARCAISWLRGLFFLSHVDGRLLTASKIQRQLQVNRITHLSYTFTGLLAPPP